jgi:hypothetical protein
VPLAVGIGRMVLVVCREKWSESWSGETGSVNGLYQAYKIRKTPSIDTGIFISVSPL